MTTIQADGTVTGRPTKSETPAEAEAQVHERYDAHDRKNALDGKREASRQAVALQASVCDPLRAAAAADPTAENCKLLAEAERWTQIQVDLTGKAVREAEEDAKRLREERPVAVRKARDTWARGVPAMLRGEIAKSADGRCAAIETAARACAADLLVPEVLPRPSELVEAEIAALVQGRYATHVDWLVYVVTCKSLRAQLTEAERRSIIANASEAINEANSMIGKTVKNQIPGPLSTQHGIFLHLCAKYCEENGLNAVPKKVLPQLEGQAAEQYAALAAPARAAIANAEARRDAALAELDTMPLTDLLARYRATADKMLHEQAETARAAAAAEYPGIDALREHMTLQGVTVAEQAARKAAGQAAFDRVLATPQPIELPIEPSCPCPENIESYRAPLAHLLPKAAPATAQALAAAPVTTLPMHETRVFGLTA